MAEGFGKIFTDIRGAIGLGSGGTDDARTPTDDAHGTIAASANSRRRLAGNSVHSEFTNGTVDDYFTTSSREGGGDADLIVLNSEGTGQGGAAAGGGGGSSSSSGSKGLLRASASRMFSCFARVG